MQPKISLCMILKDEEPVLEKFLNSIKDYADELIIIDTGSKDIVLNTSSKARSKTKEISKKFTKRIYDFRWNDDFAKARNFSISKATKEWILVLDPDEKIDKKDLEKIKGIIKKDKKEVLGYRIIQKTYYKNKIISIRGICRLFKNDKRIKFIYPIHETVRESIRSLNGKIGKTGITIKHYPKISKEKQEYYLTLLETKKHKFPESNAEKEIANEKELFNPL
ncbi:MAG: glycosyltransferase family 2 protein [Nanoarchaeota archaeon]|nr:glycosyltransferase family 2 protein [Nanoarchaeota archaeon]MBU1004535.1 glycosyltransferase family 2 protein [Nanoarchaeota archaeon]MBU1945928.1 glycosyltransferase family 2 protein [Nanoarchaeota archaeon]